MKLFTTRAEMEAIPRIRRPKEIHTTDQIVGQASRNGWTVGITMDDLVGAQCAERSSGLHPRRCAMAVRRSDGGRLVSRTKQRRRRHQASMDVVAFRAVRGDGRLTAGLGPAGSALTSV